MNGTCDAATVQEGSLSQDCWVGAVRPAAFPVGWTFYRRYGASDGWSFDSLPTNENLAYDEVHPQAYPFQTRASARRWAERVTQVSLVYMAWTAYPGLRDAALGVIEANNALVKLVPEMFFFGEDGSHTPDDLIGWLGGDNPTGINWLPNTVPCYCVSNQGNKLDPPGQPGSLKYARAFSRNPGNVMAYWARIIRAFADRGAYSALQWGFGYRDPWRDGPVDPTRRSPGVAMVAWDNTQGNVVFRG